MGYWAVSGDICGHCSQVGEGHGHLAGTCSAQDTPQHPGDLSNPEIEPRHPTLQVDYLSTEPPGNPKNTGVGSLYLSPRDPNPGIKPRSSALQVDSLPAEPLGKPKNTGDSRLSLLQQIFLTQESNHGLCHCR